ncbi:AI-2E family transporter [Clostridium sp. DSM 100503]|uniref:AI-2E family transporter n=1 Tax=Clostridium sp. DSM 100503 TaxID=2963282 RepID=UPI00214A2C0A|nr:AI-2E family transporter [Clostridium sp. DSM 100503]MCR1952568.1 AI-2E family transporter [Clostridium sp. DSM 100503]
MLITIVIAILVGIVGFKIIENYPYFFSILKKFWSLMLPVLYGLVFGYILNPLVKLIKRRFKVKEGVAILSTYLLVLAIIILASLYLIPSIIDSAVDITTKMPSYIQETQEWLDKILNNQSVKEFINTTGTTDNINHIIAQFGTMAVTLLEGSISYIFTISSQLLKLFLGLLISIYVLVDKDRLIKESKKVTFLILKEKRGKKLIEAVRIYHNMIGAYIGIKAVDSSIIAAMALVLLTIVKSEYAFLLAVIVGITNMIPYFGPFIGEIVGFLFNVFVSPTKGLIVFLVLLALQLFDGWYLDPKLIGNKVGVRPLFIIVAVLIGGGFYGALGMLLASPTAATLKVYYERIMKKNEALVKTAENS